MITVKLINESVLSYKPAAIEVYVDTELITRVTAGVVLELGADGGAYPVVKLKQESKSEHTA